MDRKKELSQAIRELEGAPGSALALLVGERYEGRTAFLRSFVQAWGRKPLVWIKWTPNDKQDPLFIATEHFLATQLSMSKRHLWKEVFRDAHDLGLIYPARIGRRDWIKKNRTLLASLRRTARPGESLPRLPRPLLHVGPEVKPFCLGYLLRLFLEEDSEITVVIDDYIVPSRQEQLRFMTELASIGSLESIRFKLVASLVPGARVSTLIDWLTDTTKLPIPVIKLDPIPVHPSLDPATYRESARTPTIPGLVPPADARSLGDRALFRRIVANPYYKKMDGWVPDTENRLLTATMGLMLLFGAVSHQDLVLVSSAFGRSSEELEGLLRDHPLIWRIKGEWLLLDGWRRYLLSRNHHACLIREVESFTSLVATRTLERSISEGLSSTLESWSLSPGATAVFRTAFDRIRDLLTRGRRPPRGRLLQARNLYIALFQLAGTDTLEFAEFLYRAHEELQDLTALDLLLTTLDSRKVWSQEDKIVLIRASEAARKWNDRSISEALFALVKARWTSIGQNGPDLLSVVRGCLAGADEALCISLASFVVHQLGSHDGLAEFAGSLQAEFAAVEAEQCLARSVLESNYSTTLTSDGRIVMYNLRSFIVHGHDLASVYELKDFLVSNLHLPSPIVLAQQASGGRTIIEKFEDVTEDIDVVFVVLSPDDLGGKGGGELRGRARQNVVFEIGYFVGRYGRRSGRVIVLKKGDLEMPSDLHGVLWISIDNGIEAAGEAIRRELAALTKISA